jgi:hypothetical protein
MRKYRVKTIFQSSVLANEYKKYYVIQKKKWYGWVSISEPVDDKERVMADCEEVNQLYNQFR